MSRSPVTVGLVGVANHGATILYAIRQSGNLRLASLFDTNSEAAGNVAADSGASIASSFEEMLEDASIRAIALVTPNQLHADQITRALQAGKDVFVEKPITTTVEQAQQVLNVARTTGRVLMVGHNTRRRRVFRRAKELLQHNAIGKLVAIEGNLSRPAGLQPGLPPWKADPSACPLLPMTQLGIHLVDTAAYLVSPVQRVSCFAAHIAMNGPVFDSTAAILQLESGIPFSLTSYYVSPDAYFMRLYGTEGILHCYPTSLRLDTVENGEPKASSEEDFRNEGAESYILQMREFGECILDGLQPETGGKEGLHALAVIEAMTRSMNEGVHVTVNDILRSTR